MLIAVNFALVRGAFMSPRFGKAIQGGNTVLFANGQLDGDASDAVVARRHERHAVAVGIDERLLQPFAHDEQIDDAVVVARLASRTLLSWQADAPTGTVAWQLEQIPNHRMEVHQATGRISVQAGVSLADALVLLRAYAFSRDRPISDVASDVATGRVRFD